MRKETSQNAVHIKCIKAQNNPCTNHVFGAKKTKHQRQPANAGEAAVLRIFLPEKLKPQLLLRTEVDDSYIAQLHAWSSQAKDLAVEDFNGVCKSAEIPGHEDYCALMYSQRDWMFVQVSHRNQGVVLEFGIAFEKSKFSQEMWSNLGGKGEQPTGFWCIQTLSSIAKDVFQQSNEQMDWLFDFQRTFYWWWVLIARVINDFAVTVDIKTGMPLMVAKN